MTVQDQLKAWCKAHGLRHGKQNKKEHLVENLFQKALMHQMAEDDEVSLQITKLPDSTHGVVQAYRVCVSFWHFSTWQAGQKMQLAVSLFKWP